MKYLRFLALVLILLAAVAAIGTGRLSSSTSARRTELTRRVRRQDDSAVRLRQLESQFQAEVARAEAVESDNKMLSEALERAKVAQRVRSAPVTLEEVEARARAVIKQVKMGDPDSLLREMLWCYDEGVRKLGRGVPPSSLSSGLLEALGELAKRHPPALVALRERRDTLRRQVMSTDGADAVPDFVYATKALGEEDTLLEALDRLPADSGARASMVIYSSDALLEAQRYAEMYNRSSFSSATSIFEMSKEMTKEKNARSTPERVVNQAAKSIEMIAGAGHLDQARDLIRRVLAFESSEGTRRTLLHHLTRAGRPELLPP